MTTYQRINREEQIQQCVALINDCGQTTTDVEGCIQALTATIRIYADAPQFQAMARAMLLTGGRAQLAQAITQIISGPTLIERETEAQKQMAAADAQLQAYIEKLAARVVRDILVEAGLRAGDVIEANYPLNFDFLDLPTETDAPRGEKK